MMKPELPKSWSTLSWQQLCQAWEVKQRYGGNPDAARAACLLSITGCTVCRKDTDCHTITGEAVYILEDTDGRRWTVTPRELSYMAGKALRWFDYPYGDPGEEAVKDESGKVVKESRSPVRGYVSPLNDALFTPIETLKVGRCHFALPQVACNNLTWRQYRSLQAIVPQLWQEGLTEDQVMALRAQFLAHVLTPRSLALFETTGGSIRLRLHHEYRYDEERAVAFEKRFARDMRKLSTLYHICLQVYQTALAYYAAAYPLLFNDAGKSDPLRDALTGEVGTVNTIMKYARYTDQQQVYEAKLPYILDILNTMTKEAKELEAIKKKKK
jgi:hypothetical protein